MQTEVDAGYEGRDQIVLVEAKNRRVTNFIIRQLYYPYRQWLAETSKSVKLLFFEGRKDHLAIWEHVFDDLHDYNSIRLKRTGKYRISEGHSDA